MEIQVIDWAIYFILLWIFNKEDDTDLEDAILWVVCTIFYIIIFSITSWREIFAWLTLNVTFT
jgi:hypothetical protein